MKNRKRVGSPLLFLLELVFSILFFSLASAVCVGLFAQSHERSRQARELNLAVNTVSSAAELVTASDSLEQLQLLMEAEYADLACTADENTLVAVASLDGNFCPAESGSGEYTLTVSTVMEGHMLRAELDVTGQSGESVYCQTVLHHIQRGNSHGQ